MPRFVLLALLTMAVRPAGAQWPPEHLENLQVLPDTIDTRALIDLMAGFTRALGVRCTHCHVGEEGQPLATYDFPSDEKAAKRKAREMLRMVQAINGEFLPRLAERQDPPVMVQCATCHGGVTAPRQLQEVVLLAYDAGGIDSAVAAYGALRERYFGRAAYDFGDVPLTDAGRVLAQRGALTDAVVLYRLNAEHHPDSWFAFDRLGAVLAAAGDTAQAVASYEKSLAINPQNGNARARLRALRGG